MKNTYVLVVSLVCIYCKPKHDVPAVGGTVYDDLTYYVAQKNIRCTSYKITITVIQYRSRVRL